MNRQTPRAQTQAFPPGYRPSAPQGQSSNAMFYATAGQQATTTPSRQGTAGQSVPGPQQGGSGAPGFPPLGGGLSRGPPGFGARSTETSEFPALGSLSSTYASQAQPTQPGSTSTSQHHQQQMYLQGAPGLAPPPPPGIGTSPSQHLNGLPNDQARDDFPSLNTGEGKDRIPSYMRNQLSQSPPPLVNGNSNSSSATPSTNPPIPTSGAGTMESWGRHSPNNHNRLPEPVVRPVQQLLVSPVDKWGLKQLLFEIKSSMGKTDRGMLLFGEELSDLGMDLAAEEPLYPSFVTPWIDPNSHQQAIRIEEQYHLPACYNVVAPPVQTKIPNFTEDTLFFAFYTSPQDVLQLEVAEELFNRGWRYHTEMQVWLTSSTAVSAPLDQPGPNWIRGPFVVFDPRTYSRSKTADEFMIDASLLEATRSASAIVQEEHSRQEGLQSPNGNASAGYSR